LLGSATPACGPFPLLRQPGAPSIPTITRTTNPLPFGDLEPKRFEDLVRQLAYDFKPWRRLEATGKAGSDDGFDARGYEKVYSADEPASAREFVQESAESADAQSDRLWLVQCKREKAVGPKKMRSYLNSLVLDAGTPLHGIVFAAACDFSLTSRNELARWCAENGLFEWQIWGKSELEDMLFQPKNDGLLFAYFGISLAIRRRSIVNTKRQEIAIKRSLGAILDGSSHIPMLLRDVDDDTYPYLDAALPVRWRVREVIRLGAQGVWVALGKAPAWLSPDHQQWDAALMAFDPNLDCSPHTVNPWRHAETAEQTSCVQHAAEQWQQFPKNERAWLYLTGIIAYQNIVAIDDGGDEHFEDTHLYIANWCMGYVEVFATVEPLLGEPEKRYVYSDADEDRVKKFDSSLRAKRTTIGSQY
jgi:hypothetical protein